MTKVLELREQKASLIVESRKLLNKAEADNNRDLHADEQEQWVKLNKDIDAIEENIRKAERNERLENLEANQRAIEPRKLSPSQPSYQRSNSKTERNKAWRNWLAYGSPISAISGDDYNRNAECGMPLSQTTINTRSINTSSGSAGGNATFQTFYDQCQTQMKYFSPIIDRVNVIVTSDGNNFVLPRGTDVANMMAIVSQTSGSGTSTDPTFDKVTLGSYFFRYIELVTYEALADTAFDIESWITARLAERAARTLEYYIVAGTGSSQPTGLLTAAVNTANAAVTLASGHNTLYRFDDLFSLFHNVDLAYRPNCTLVLSDQAVWDMRSIKDSQNRYIWDINNSLVQNSQPDNVAGFKYLVSNSIPATGSFSANVAVFADLSRHVVRMADAIQITRLNELYRGNGMIGFEVLMRFDCNYVGHPTSLSYIATPGS